MLCVGSSIGVLVAGRLLQGLSAAVVWTVGLALLVDTVGQKEIGQVMGYVSLSVSIAILVAPLLGGVVYARGGYYAVFAMAFALIGLDIVLRLALVEKKIAKKWSITDEDGSSENSIDPDP
jgi:MFS family permease